MEDRSIEFNRLQSIAVLLTSLWMTCIAVETILLAFQNYILMLGTSVMIPSMLVPAMGGSSVSWFCVIVSLDVLHSQSAT